MADQHRAAQEAKSKKVNHPVVEQTATFDLGEEQTALPTLPVAMIGATGDGLIEGQSARLGDTRFQTVQRQTMASQIGWGQGNAHLQRLVSSLYHNGKGNGAVVARKGNHNGYSSGTGQTTVTETDGLALGEESSGGSGALTFSPAPPPSNEAQHANSLGSPVQRQEETADDAPTEAEKKIALAKARTAQQEAAQTSNEGKQQVDQSKAEKAAEKQAGEVAKQKTQAEKSAIEQTKAAGEGKAGGEAVAPESEGAAVPGGLNGAGPEAATVSDPSAPDYKAPATSEEDPAFQATLKQVKGTATKEQVHAPAATKAKESQAAAESPPGEKEAKAQDKQVGEMDQAETPGFNAKAFKAQLMQRIQELAPKNAEDADNFKKGNKLSSVKDDMQGQVATEKETSQGPVKAATEKAPDTGSVLDKPVTPLMPAQPGAPPPDVGAEKAVPKPKGTGEVEKPLKQETQRIDQQMAEGNVSDEQLAKANEPSFQSALDAKKEAKTQAAQAGTDYRQAEQGQISQAEGEAAATAQEAVQAMHGNRASLLQQVAGRQGTAKSKDEEERAKVASDIQKIYSRTKASVERLLGELDGKVDKAFDAGAKEARQVFEDYVEAKMEAYKEERYGGWFGWARWIKDKVAGMPSAVNAFYQQGRNKYLQKMDAVIDNVVTIIGRGLTEAKAEIAKGKKEIQEYVAGLPKHLQKVGQEAASDIQDKFAALEDQVNSKQDELVDKLAQKYQENLQAIDSRIEALKEANKGLVDKVVDAVKGVVETIKKLKRMLDTVLAKISDVVSLIIDDPIGFLGKLIDGLKQGFNNFVANIGTHLQKGLIMWLTGAMQGVNIQMPDDIFSLPGIFSLVMQILGLSWDYIRKKAVKLLGEKVVAALEAGFEPFKILVTEGPAGLWQWVKGEFSDLKETVMDAIKNMIITEVIKAGVKWVLGLLNPVGAFIKACMAIYEIIMFFVNNAERILKLIEAIVDAAGAIARGAISTGAKLVEDALGRMVPLIIGFLASLLGISGLAKKVQGIIKKVRRRIDKMVDKLLMKAKKAVGKLFKRGKVKGKDVEKGKFTEKDRKAGLAAFDMEEKPFAQNGTITQENAAKVAGIVKKKHPVFKSVKVVDGKDSWDYDYVFRATKDTTGTTKPKSKELENVQAAVNSSGGIIGFMKAIAAGKRPMQIGRAKLEMLWKQAEIRDWLKDCFRRANKGKHEWIPSNMMMDVINRTAGVETGVKAADWIQLQHELRVDTSWVIFKPSKSEWVANHKGKSYTVLQGHSGAVYFEGEAQTAGQPAFHNELRAAFESGTTVKKCISRLQEVFKEWVWEGEKSNSVHPKLRFGLGGSVSTVKRKQKRNFEKANKRFEQLKERKF
ncbi:MAG: hypothetical protein JXR84_25635 [Anaerolineae bacterium]|nr:hypothetical protein [Anaerolineae bacterium]